jgi:hypothetical protein
MALEMSNDLVAKSDGTSEVYAYLDGARIFRLDVPKSASTFQQAPPPSQRDVDCVASFVEAAEELAREPFFGPDEKRSFSHGGSTQTFHLGDRFHFRSALISFRRIWMSGEISNFYTVYGILWRHAKSVEERLPLLWARGFIQNAEKEKRNYPLTLEISGKDLVDLWINTVFAHGGGDEKRRHKRVDFDRFVSQCGHAPLEYSFRMVVWNMGLQYIHVSNSCCRPALERWKAELQLQPSFQIGAAFGTSTRERTKEGHIIIRRASSEYAADETFDQRLRRILDRSQFSNLKFIFSNIDLGDKNLVRLVMGAADFSSIAGALGYEIQIVDVLSDKPGDYREGFRGSSGLWDGKRRSGIQLFGLSLVTDATGLEILNGLIADLKRTLLSD